MPQDNSDFYPCRDPAGALGQDQAAFLASAEITLGLPSLFYGSLCDDEVLRVVTGRGIGDVRREHVEIRGCCLGVVNAGKALPGLFPSDNPEDRVECLLLHDLSRFEQTMVAWFEWDEYALQQLGLPDGRRAQVFVPDLGAVHREHGRYRIQPWSSEQWRRRHRLDTLSAARRWMAQRPDDHALARAGCFEPAQATVPARSA